MDLNSQVTPLPKYNERKRQHGSICCLKANFVHNLIVGGYEDGSILVFDIRNLLDPVVCFKGLHKDAGKLNGYRATGSSLTLYCIKVLGVDMNAGFGVSCGADNATCSWSMSDSSMTNILVSDTSSPGANSIKIVGNSVVVGCWSGELQVLDLEAEPVCNVPKLSTERHILHHRTSINALHKSCNNTIFAGSDDRTISSWSLLE